MIKCRKYNPNLIKKSYTYTLAEIAEVYGIHVRTAQTWHKNGLKPIDENFRPYLFMGETIRDFIRAKRKKNKFKLECDEFNCNKCRQPRKSIPAAVQYLDTGRMLGKFSKQIIIKGICEICGTKLNRFASTRIMNENEAKLTEHIKGLNGNEFSYLNTDLERNIEIEQSKP